MSKLITNFQNLCRQKSNHTISELAKHIGISRVTFYNLLYDDWKQIQRDTIEKVCDYFNCNIDDLFQLEENPFWLPFLKKRHFHFIIGGTLETGEAKNVIGFWDIKVVNEIATSLNRLSGNEPLNFNFISSLEFGNNDEEIIDFIRKNNTIVIGSPKINPITEIVIAKLYGAVPFDDSEENRKKIPYRFIRPEEWGISTQQSAVTEIWKNRPERGIYSQKADKIVATNEYYDNFFNTQIPMGKDCGLLLVVNKPFETQKNVKLIILAGYSGLGTHGLAKQLIKESKNLEPKTTKPVAKVIKIEYTKPTQNRDDREIKKMAFVNDK